MEMFLKDLFNKQQVHQFHMRQSNAESRIAKLKRLKEAILKREELLFEALRQDLRKNKFESAITEVYFIYSEIDFAIKHLKRWMKPKRRASTLTSILSSNRVIYESIGVSLIIAPWNYPFQLTMSPLISAIAAGNCVILKPSEFSPCTSKVIKELIIACFPADEVCCLEGKKELATSLLELPFDHIFFTGSPAIGKIVMQAASKNLSAVTLELGGKSPVIIDQEVNLKEAAYRIAWGKLINAGQTCIAPDYLLIPENLVNEFCEYYKTAVEDMFYHAKGAIDVDRYAKIINKRHLFRLESLLNNAIQNGAKIAWKAKNTDDETFPPILLNSVDLNNPIMQEEIFGPILPLITYRDLQEAIAMIRNKPKPLALYIFSKKKVNVNRIISSCSSGSVCINDVLIQVSNPNLPFGGVNESGLGSCHGFYGFKAFSHERAIMKQASISFSKMIYPPYQQKDKLLKLLKRWM